MRTILFLAISLLLGTAQAKTTQYECPSTAEEKFGTTVIRTFYADIGLCSISISPRDGWQTLTYRDYSVSSDGLLMVFNAFGSSGDFGVRNFMLFPRTKEHISYKWIVENKEVHVTGASGDVYVFDANTAQIKSITGASKVVVGAVSRNNRAGVEIEGYKGQLLDVGYAFRQDPSQNKEGLSKFTDGTKTCQIRNNAIFNYTKDGDVQFKFENDKNLTAVIKAQCR